MPFCQNFYYISIADNSFRGHSFASFRCVNMYSWLTYFAVLILFPYTLNRKRSFFPCRQHGFFPHRQHVFFPPVDKLTHTHACIIKTYTLFLLVLFWLPLRGRERLDQSNRGHAPYLPQCGPKRYTLTTIVTLLLTSDHSVYWRKKRLILVLLQGRNHLLACDEMTVIIIVRTFAT